MCRCFALTILFTFLSIGIHCQSTITFYLDELPDNELANVGIRGNIEPLSWEKSILLKKEGDKYSVTIDFSETNTELEFKFVRFKNDKKPSWESIDNRTLQLTNANDLVSTNSWDVEQVVDVKSLEPISSSTFSRSLSHGEAYLAISKLTAKLKCDHTKAGFNNQNKTINSVIHRQQDKLPFTFKWVNEKMVVIENASESTLLRRGTVVQSIDGVPVLEIRNNLMQYVGADGATDGNRLSKLEVNGYDFRYNAFDIFYPLAYQVDAGLQLEIKEHKEKESTVVKVQPLTRNIAVLTLNSFGLVGWKAIKLDYKEYFKNVFTQLSQQKIEHLIIDIRINDGGNDEVAKDLFDYLTTSESSFQREGRTRYVDFPKVLRPHVQTWGENPWYFALSPKVKKPTNGG